MPGEKNRKQLKNGAATLNEKLSPRLCREKNL
jgi:hypothetical protein